MTSATRPAQAHPGYASAKMTRGLWWCFGAAVATAAVADLFGAQVLFAVALVALMPLLLAVLATSSRQLKLGQGGRRLVALTVAALLFSWFGDATGPLFLPKVAFFLVAQCCYIAAFWPFRRESVWRRPGFALGYLAAVGVGVGVVTPYAGALAVPVLVYAACLALMASLATGVGRGAGWGGVLFVLSDTVLALDHFVGWLDVPHVYLWNVITYATAQALLVHGVLRRARTPAPSTTVVSA